MNILRGIIVSMFIAVMSISIELEVNVPNQENSEKSVNPIATELPHEW